MFSSLTSCNEIIKPAYASIGDRSCSFLVAFTRHNSMSTRRSTPSLRRRKGTQGSSREQASPYRNYVSANTTGGDTSDGAESI